ncbi:RagB/SusD domain protein [Pseudopedobacter saltans DSM 12145]|uniref:RagB/SusD domain protein n=1 Tax=Pseudopedobacter saltans (strain ATCC 51119 / DSM 12145 / JCM 21818 / CCUG 39354 / LMG 10337 / NBRC 100064 / NCIMB 13643) TaxID=762903 RepID=F0S7Y4_PSESL|nr:RagB/SusD family nutrient uptake outer membrane protein [Pseudopedobacter saltans]ADY51205.1 RagB/SusD domain protein [Pseudopedobacter saltans DSM 12145]
MNKILKHNKKLLASIFLSVSLVSCQKSIDLQPISNVGAEDYYKNFNEVSSALTGCYSGLHKPLYNEWMFTELRSDNSKQGVPNSTNVANAELNALDMFTLNPFHERVYDYWLDTYNNIRAINYVLRSLGVKYENKEIVVSNGTAEMSDVQRNKIMGEALFLRAYHYFNLVRLFGGVFLVDKPVSPQEAKLIQRSSVNDLYDFIVADLKKANEVFPHLTFATIPQADLGRANIWSSKSLLAKVYLTLGQKNESLILLNDVINNSGYGLVSSYSDVFSISNEMNKEIIFAIRYKAGGLGLGSPFANLFAPTGSGNAVVNNDGNGYNFPTEEMKTIYKVGDLRKDVTIAQYTATRPYVKKFLSQVSLRYDAENDFPIIRYSDILLMKAEALGYDNADGESVALINQVRTRAGALDYGSNTDFAGKLYKYPSSGTESLSNAESFRKALLNERRIEFAFENQRYFDIMRQSDAVEIIKNHFAEEFANHYVNIIPPITLSALQANVTKDRLLLPIPQKERDKNDQIDIGQNPGY